MQVFSLVGGIALTILLSRFLPDRVAIHFNISGQPDGWASNGMNTVFFSATFLILNALFAGIALLMKKIPVSLINMPNREYWFAPERRAASAYVLGTFFAELCFFLNIFLSGILLMTFFANRTQGQLPPAIMFSWLGVFLIFVVLWIVHLLKAFRLPKA